MKTVLCRDAATLYTVPAGSFIALEGSLVTLRDGALARIAETKKRGETLPVVLEGRVVFFAGPTPGIEQGRGSIGPTTTRRMSLYFPLLAECGVTALVGKGPLDENSYTVLHQAGVCYLQAVGGAGAFYGSRVTSVRIAGYEDLGPEAIYELTVRDFVVMMSLDSKGNRYP